MKKNVIFKFNKKQGRSELEECTARIRRGLMAFMEILEPLDRVRTEKLYLYATYKNGTPKYRTFEEYTKVEFGFARSYLSKLRSGYTAVRQLEGHVEPEAQDKISTPRAAYALSRIPEEKRAEAVTELAAVAGDGKITGNMISNWQKEKSAGGNNTSAATASETQLSFCDDARVIESDDECSDNISDNKAPCDATDTEETADTVHSEEDASLNMDAYDDEDNEEDEEDNDDESYEDETDDDFEDEVDEADYNSRKIDELRGILDDNLARKAANDERLFERLSDVVTSFWESVAYYRPQEVQDE